MKRRKGFYSISVVAKMFGVHQQTVRLYEKEGLISPKRSSGNTRLFSEEDVDKLEEVIYLTHKMGVNLAGVEMVMKLQKKIKKLQSEMNNLFEETHGQLVEESEDYKKEIKQQAEHLIEMKDKKKSSKKDGPIDVEQESAEVEADGKDEDWEIEYDDD
jgi:MerR family transcriptional regulator, heat shock protein HspR